MLGQSRVFDYGAAVQTMTVVEAKMPFVGRG